MPQTPADVITDRPAGVQSRARWACTGPRWTLPVLRAPRRPLPARQRPLRTGGVAGRAPDRQRLQPPRRLEHVPRRGRSGLPGASAPRLRDAVTLVRRGPHRPLRLARRRGALRRRRRAVADRRPRHRARRDVPAARRAGDNPLELFQLAQPAGAQQDVRALLLDALVGAAAAGDAARCRRRRTEVVSVAGTLPGLQASPAPPPDSWASDARSDLASSRSRSSLARTARCPPPPGRRRNACSTSLPATRCRWAARTASGQAALQVDATRPLALANPGARRCGAAAAPGPPDRRAGRAVRAVRDEHRGRDPRRLRRLPAHALRRLAVAERGAGARRRRTALRLTAGRPACEEPT